MIICYITCFKNSKCYDCKYNCGTDELGTFCEHPEIYTFQYVIHECDKHEKLNK